MSRDIWKVAGAIALYNAYRANQPNADPITGGETMRNIWLAVAGIALIQGFK